MIVEEAAHRFIGKPSGIPGYGPRNLCAVCGLSEDQSRDLQCTEEGCPNLYHIDCLLDDPENDSHNRGELNVRIGIRNLRVVFVQDQTHSPTFSS